MVTAGCTMRMRGCWISYAKDGLDFWQHTFCLNRLACMLGFFPLFAVLLDYHYFFPLDFAFLNWLILILPVFLSTMAAALTEIFSSNTSTPVFQTSTLFFFSSFLYFFGSLKLLLTPLFNVARRNSPCPSDYPSLTPIPVKFFFRTQVIWFFTDLLRLIVCRVSYSCSTLQSAVVVLFRCWRRPGMHWWRVHDISKNDRTFKF